MLGVAFSSVSRDSHAVLGSDVEVEYDQGGVNLEGTRIEDVDTPFSLLDICFILTLDKEGGSWVIDSGMARWPTQVTIVREDVASIVHWERPAVVASVVSNNARFV